MVGVLTISGRINFLQLARYCKSCEQRFRQNFRKKFDWIAADTKPDDFAAIFSGEESNSRIKWIGTQQHLYYLIYTLVKRQIVAIPVKTTIWQITESHFTDGKNCPFHDFNKQKAPARAKYAIEKMVDILDLSIR